MICTTLLCWWLWWMVRLSIRIAVSNELWDGIFSSLFIKDGPVCPVLKEAIKEALKLLSLVFGELEQLLLWSPRRYFRVCVIYSGNLQKQIGMHTWSVKYFRFHSRRCAVINSSVESNQTKRFKTKKKYIEESTQSVCWLYGLILIIDDWQHERTNLEGKLVSRVSGEFVFNPFLLIKRWLCCKQLR